MKQRLRLQKFAPIDRESPIYEIVLGNDVIFDITKDVAGHHSITFHGTNSEEDFSLEEVESLIAEAKRRLIQE